MSPIPLTIIALVVGVLLGLFVGAILSSTAIRAVEARYGTARRALQMIADDRRGVLQGVGPGRPASTARRCPNDRA